MEKEEELDWANEFSKIVDDLEDKRRSIAEIIKGIL